MKSGLHCPYDGALLALREHLGQPWYSCNECEGAFLPLSMTPELLPVLEQVVEYSAAWPRSSLCCPQCGGMMHVAHHEGIEIDLCRDCRAVWLDEGELGAIHSARMREEMKEEAQTEGLSQGYDTLAGNKGSGFDVSDALDWLGEALGGLLSP